MLSVVLGFDAFDAFLHAPLVPVPGGVDGPRESVRKYGCLQAWEQCCSLGEVCDPVGGLETGRSRPKGTDQVSSSPGPVRVRPIRNTPWAP